jgi:hypothetical protein
MNQNWGIVAVVAAFLITFGTGAWLANNRVNAPPAAVSAPASPPAKEEKKEEPPPPPPPRKIPPKSTLPKTRERYQGVVTKEAQRAVVQQFSIGGSAEKEEAHKPTYFRRIYVDPLGTRVVTRTETETASWDLHTGYRLQTFKHDGKGIYCSPDARVVATLSKNAKQMILKEAASGRTIGTYSPPAGGDIIVQEHEPTYTPGGDFLLVCVKDRGKEAIAAISTQTGVGKLVKLPREWYDTTGHQWRELIPRPRENRFYRQLVAFPCCAMNLADGINTKVESLTIGPQWEPPYCRAVKVSPDGHYLTGRNRSQLRIIDLESDLIVFKLNIQTLTGEWFTPDARRVVSLRAAEWIYKDGDGLNLTPEGGWLSVYAIPQGPPPPVKEMTDRPEILGLEFIMDQAGLKGLADLAFLADGRRFVMLDRGTTVAVIDFGEAFGVAPLPALPRPNGPEPLPLR